VTDLRKRSGHVPLLAMATVVNLCLVPAFALLPLLVVERGGGAATLGWLNSAFGIGTIAGDLLLGIAAGHLAIDRRTRMEFVNDAVWEKDATASTIIAPVGCPFTYE